MPSIFSFFNITGYNFTFMLNKKEKHYSTWGGLVSLAFWLLSLFYIGNSLYMFIERKEIKESFQYKSVRYPVLEIKKNPSFMLVFCLNKGTNVTEADPIVNAALDHKLFWKFKYKKPWLIEQQTQIPLQKCSYEMFPLGSINFFQFQFFSQCMCAPNKVLKPYNMSFALSSEYQTYFEYTLTYKASLKKDLNMLKFYHNYLRYKPPRSFLYLVDNSIEIDNLSRPMFTHMNYHDNYLNVDFSAHLELFYNLVQFIDSQGLFFEKNVVHSGINLQETNIKIQTQFDVTDPTSKIHPFLKARFQASPRVISFKRTFMTIEELFQKIFSFLAFFFVLTIFICQKMNSYEGLNALANNLFKNHGIKSNMLTELAKLNAAKNEDFPMHKVPVANQAPDMNYIPVGRNSNRDDLNNEENAINTEKKIDVEVEVVNNPVENYQTKKKTPMETENYELHLKANEFENQSSKMNNLKLSMCKYCCCRGKFGKRRMENYKNAIGLVHYFLDTQVYLKKQIEFEIFKFALFNKSERKLISYLSNPDFDIGFEAEFHRNLNIEYKKEVDQNLAERLNNTLSVVKTKGRDNAISNRLLKLCKQSNKKLTI